jgi:hypothetical protein
MEDGTILAVKRLKDVTTGRKEFEAQLQAVGRLQHRNLCGVTSKTMPLLFPSSRVWLPPWYLGYCTSKP